MRWRWLRSGSGQIGTHGLEGLLHAPQLLAQRIEGVVLGRHQGVELLHLIVEEREAGLQLLETVAIAHQRIRIFTPCPASQRFSPEQV